ncbi:hypothetical protein S40285_04733 [Stachybotrys chlorohalonatus IBT 40285]|uniref:Cytochrome c oxidase subunit 9, mitochondrial n=2 Tax=Stachybotrys TaxID=74721 RepID=A0A084Q9U7_STAC4|nr:hypothetical protein S7711_11080 [Stachybotrys chartarum IBT 7711]KFA47209.1 hypothetical protein S40293_11107 [Stachybotrys chartarum IBT 40293]KFA60732.1 hypothetical protein S40285_04733 [Stachybotrys chlorohalonata IBT 40285]KFA74494.1 hypothetical protein S40288_11396 [Stachybotrys chartarum IBT 40288]
MAIKPITGMIRRQLILDLGIGLGAGFAMANVWWYGFHVPRTNARDAFYTRQEQKEAAERA